MRVTLGYGIEHELFLSHSVPLAFLYSRNNLLRRTVENNSPCGFAAVTARLTL